jgi:hypothetical protein
MESFALAGVVHLVIRKAGQPSRVDGCAHWQIYQISFKYNSIGEAAVRFVE